MGSNSLSTYSKLSCLNILVSPNTYIANIRDLIYNVASEDEYKDNRTFSTSFYNKSKSRTPLNG